MVRGGEPRTALELPVDESDATIRQALSDVAPRRAREEHDQVGNAPREHRERVDEHVRPLDRLRLEAVAEPGAVLDERADDERLAGQPERSARRLPPGGVGEGERSELDPDRDAVNQVRRNPRREHELLELAVRDVNALEARGIPAKRLVGAVELREAGRSGPPVEVREPEPVGRPGPARVERGEVARVEDDLVTGGGRPVGSREPVARPAGDRGDVRRLVVERPGCVVAEHEQLRVRPPVPRSELHGCGSRAPQGRAKEAGGAHPPSTSRYASATSASAGTTIAARRSSSSAARRSSAGAASSGPSKPTPPSPTSSG